MGSNVHPGKVAVNPTAAMVSRNIAALRRARGLRQVDLAEKVAPALGVTWSSAVMSAAETGRRVWTAGDRAGTHRRSGRARG